MKIKIKVMNIFIKKNAESINKIKILEHYLNDHNGFIAGGCFKNIFKNERLKDIDIFFRNEDDFNDAWNFYDDMFGMPYYENDKVVAFKKRDGIVIELIRYTFGTPEEILQKFDFSITKFALYRETKPLITSDSIEDVDSFVALYHQDFFEHLLTNKLVIEPNLLFPVSTFERTLRYTRYGYGLCKESKLNLIKALNNPNINLEELSGDLYNGLD